MAEMEDRWLSVDEIGKYLGEGASPLRAATSRIS